MAILSVAQRGAVGAKNVLLSGRAFLLVLQTHDRVRGPIRKSGISLGVRRGALLSIASNLTEHARRQVETTDGGARLGLALCRPGFGVVGCELIPDR